MWRSTFPTRWWRCGCTTVFCLTGSRQGAHLPEEKRKEYEKLMNTIIEKQNEFSKNLAEEKTELHFKEADLKGVPEVTMNGSAVRARTSSSP